MNEPFTEFKASFSYGSRNDLSFKFLAGLPEDAAADFLQGLLTKLGETMDDGNLERLIDHVVAGQIQGYSEPTAWRYNDGPFAKLDKPLNATRIGLLTSTGHFVDGHDPEPFGIKGMTQDEAIDRISDFVKAAPDLSQIPLDTPLEKLRVRHGGYDIRGVSADPNVAFPLNRMRELAADGTIGAAASPAYSFVGAAAQRRLLKESGPAWLAEFQQQEIEGMILVPV